MFRVRSYRLEKEIVAKNVDDLHRGRNSVKKLHYNWKSVVQALLSAVWSYQLPNLS